MNHRDITTKLMAAGIETAALELRIILEDIAGISAVDLITREIELSDDIQQKIKIPSLIVVLKENWENTGVSRFLEVTV